MESNKNPLQYFEDLLEYDKTNKLRDLFIAECVEYLGHIDSIDIEKGIIKYWDNYYEETTDSYTEGITSISFEKHFNTEINYEYKKAKKQIDSKVIEISSNGINPTEFLNVQIHILKSLYLKSEIIYLENPIVKNAIIELKNYLPVKFHKVVDRSRINYCSNLGYYF